MQKTLIVVASLCITGLLAFGIYTGVTYFTKTPENTRSEAAKEKSSSAGTASQTSQDVADPDDHPESFYGTTLPLHITSYSLAGPTNDYPAATEAGWDDFLQWSRNKDNPIIDPQTKQELRFTTTTPRSGEIQYIRHATCKESSHEFEMLSPTSRTFAFKVVVDGEIWCKSNVS